jgi:hypothetical protein
MGQGDSREGGVLVCVVLCFDDGLRIHHGEGRWVEVNVEGVYCVLRERERERE